jgi:methylated-DNA-protein-cysteine methyltransferase-like protein
MSYGQLALYAGKPGHAREAGYAMRSLGGTPNFPWWRVLNSQGKISISGNPSADAVLQQDLLKQEGVEFRVPFSVDMRRYQHHAKEADLIKLGLDDWVKKSALHKYGGPEETGSLGI